MIVKIVYDEDKHYTFYEGNLISFHPKGKFWKYGVSIVVEGRNGRDCTAVEVKEGSDTQIFLMNDQGKTVEKLCV